MKYHHLVGATQTRSSNRRWLSGLPVIGLLVAAYGIVNFNAPLLQGIDGRSPQATAQKLLSAKPGSDGNRLYIPQINVDIPIAEDVAALRTAAVRPQVSSGDPASGGTMVLGAQRLNVGVTPAETTAQSPFYHLDKLQPGDELFVDWQGKRYVYQVKQRIMVDALDSLPQKAAANGVPSLALYIADDNGGLARDTAVKAERVGTVAWGKKPTIQRTANN